VWRQAWELLASEWAEVKETTKHLIIYGATSHHKKVPYQKVNTIKVKKLVTQT
jgi:hypothetical protein